MFQLGSSVVNGVKGRVFRQSATMLIVAVVLVALLAGLAIIGKSQAGVSSGKEPDRVSRVAVEASAGQPGAGTGERSTLRS